MHLVAGPMNGSMSFLQLPDLALDNDGDTEKKTILHNRMKNYTSYK